jgi:predicted nuclease of predicted toxin-antitoxin system
MKVLLDECLPKKLKRKVNGDVVKTVPEMGWAGKKNGALLRLAEQEFDVLLTNDQNLEYQQNLERFNLAVIVLAAHTNDIEDLGPLMPAANEALKTIRVGEIVHIEASAG